MAPSPRATRRDNWARGCTGGATDFGPALLDNVTPGSPAFLLGKQVGALVLGLKRLQIAARDARRAAQPAQSGRGSGRAAAAAQGGRFNAAPASYGQGQPRRVGWGEEVQYAPDDRPQRSGPAGKGGKGGNSARPVLN